ncbi:MAG: 40S ribosomal protein S23 [Chaenotheca gracillima]|nr:MAG: 40S ribosomal protein S23 [Chaenotheca gracillima]
MGKAGRFACIFVPLGLTIATLVCLILVGLGGTNKNASTLDNLYFFKADTSKFDINAGLNLIPGTDKDDDLLSQGLDKAKDAVNLKDIYTISLWNYCDGTVKDNVYIVEECSKRQTAFWFDPLKVWGLDGSPLAKAFPKEYTDAMNAYHKVSTWMFWAYVVAFVATIVELIVGFFAIFSRWGSFATTIVAGIAFLFTIGASITATAMFSTLAGSFNSYLKDYNIHGSLGKSMFVTTWLAVAFSAGASLFWLLSVCCCSGRSDHKANQKAFGSGSRTRSFRSGRNPHEYERVGSPFVGSPHNGPASRGVSGMPMKPVHSPAYEPYRQEV